MLTQHPTTRPGISLIESMIAIGVMAIGLLSLLTLFPLGALQIGKALKDDRCSETALQADAYLRAYWKRRMIEPGSPDTALKAVFDDPDGTGPVPPITDAVTEPGYPVFIDPVGANSSGTPMTLTGSSIVRHNLGISDPSEAVRVCTLPDDIIFDVNGAPVTPLSRGGKYIWAAFVQREKGAVATATYTTKILVYDRRPALLPVDERHIPTPVTCGSTTLTLDLSSAGTSDIALLRRGGWIIDATQDATKKLRNANCYRIAAFDSLGGNTYTVDLETPIANDWDDNPVTGGYTADLYLFPDLADVFNRPTLPAITP